MENAPSKTQKHAEIVSRIISLLQSRGPTLPIHIASETGLSMLFASAFLSELISKKIVKVSNMKIGSSPLYYIPGQEEQLVKFAEYIKGRERDAFDFLQKDGLLRDDYLEPAIRVAMRSLRDFAFPLQANLDGKSMIFWRFFTLPESDAKDRIRAIFEKPAPTPAPAPIPIQIPVVEEKKVRETHEEPRKKKEILEIFDKKPEKRDNSKYLESIKEKLASEGIEVLESMDIKKKDLIFKARADSGLGKIDLLAVFKDKKKLNEIDLTMALQRAQAEKLPCLFITEGDLNKRGLEYLEQWKNLLFFKKIKLQ